MTRLGSCSPKQLHLCKHLLADSLAAEPLCLPSALCQAPSCSDSPAGGQCFPTCYGVICASEKLHYCIWILATHKATNLHLCNGALPLGREPALVQRFFSLLLYFCSALASPSVVKVNPAACQRGPLEGLSLAHWKGRPNN